MATSGPHEFSTASSDSSNLGVEAWIDTADGLDSDLETYAQAGSLDTITKSEYYKAVNASGFSALPGGASVTEIVVRVTPSTEQSTNVIKDDEMFLVKAGTIQTDDQGSATTWSSSTERVYTFDVSGSPWSKSDMTSTTTGFVLAAIASTGSNKDADIGYCTMECTYTVEASGPAIQSGRTGFGLPGLGL